MRTTATAQMDKTPAPAVTRRSLAPVDSEALDAGGTTTKQFCPRCEAPVLQEVIQDGVSIDRCLRCDGIWLDCGELELLIARAIRPYNHHARPALRHLSAREYAELFWEEA